MKTLKYLVFIPVCMLAIGIISFIFIRLVDWTINRTVHWYHELDIVYFVLLIPLFWGTIWGVFKLAAIGLAALLTPISPEKKFSIYSIATLAIINCVVLLVDFWTREIYYSWRIILMTLVISIFIIDYSASILLVFSKKESLDADE